MLAALSAEADIATSAVRVASDVSPNYPASSPIFGKTFQRRSCAACCGGRDWMESGLRILEVRHRETHASTRLRIARGVPFAEDGQRQSINVGGIILPPDATLIPRTTEMRRMWFAEIRPVPPPGRVRRERHSRGRRSHFHRIGFGAAQNVSEEAFLPMRGFDGGSRRVLDCLPQALHPSRAGEFSAVQSD